MSTLKRRTSSKLLASLVATLLIAACATTPTGRRQLQFFPSDQVAEMGHAAFQQMRQKEPLSEDPRINEYVQCVVQPLTAVVEAPEGGGKWNVTVFKSDQVNAFALPGGNIGVYTGLLKAARTADQLAAVIGHEIGHVQARHANARLSTQFAAEAGLALIQAIGQGTAVQSQQALALLGLGVQVGLILPFSRAQETESDILGLRYMAQAGFDPRAAIELWKNMEKASGNGPPAFLSTHPSGEQRIATLQKHMPEALATYQKAQAAGLRPRCRPPG